MCVITIYVTCHDFELCVHIKPTTDEKRSKMLGLILAAWLHTYNYDTINTSHSKTQID